MLKKISFFAFVALILVGCNSNEEEKKRGFKDSVYAFVNTQPNVVGYGRIDIASLVDESNIEQVGVFQLLASETYEGLKKQVDLNGPVYFVSTTSEGHTDLTNFVMFELKNKKNLVDDWTTSGYEFKEHKGISYAEEEYYIIAAKDNVAMLISIPGDFDAKKTVEKAFESTKGKIAPNKVKKQLEAKGDFVMHMNLDALKANDPSLALMPSGTELDIAMNSDKGQLIIESKVNNFGAIQKQTGLEKTKEPLLAKKVTDENGNIVMAVQLSVRSKLMDLFGVNEENIQSSVNLAPLMLEDKNVSLNISDLEEGDNIMMPSGKAMGGEFMEMKVNLDAALNMFPEYQDYKEYYNELDFASLSVNQDGTVQFVITTDEKGKNFLAVVFKSVDNFMNNGGLMQLMAMQ